MTTQTLVTPSRRVARSVGRFVPAALLGLVCAMPAAAQDALSMGAYLQAGRSPGSSDTNAATLGFTGPLLVGREFLGARLYYEASISQWRADNASGARTSYTQLAFVPTARWRLDEGRSPWFVDAGLGLSYLDGDYNTPEHRFGSRWNFTERLALGRSFGAQGRHEISLGLQHFSNAGIKKPNPGENFVSVRYAARF